MTHILVVDDDRPVACSIATLLEVEGFDVAVAVDGRSGVDAVTNARFDLVIVDMLMPEMSGLETIAAIRREHPTLPIIAITGFAFREAAPAQTDLLARALELGAARGLYKPFRRRDIVEAVASCLLPAAA